MSRLLRLATSLPEPIRRTIKSIPGSDWLRAIVADRPKGSPVPTGGRRTVVYLPTWVHWDVMRQRPQYLLAAFGRLGFDVVFVDPDEKQPRTADGVRIVPSVRHAPRSGVILYTHFAPIRRLIDGFEDAVVVYDLLDDLSIYDEQERGIPEKRRVRAHHPGLMRRADAVIASNRVLVDRHLDERGDILLVENGVDAARFGAPREVPDDLAGLARPIVGYHGMISHWFDFDLFEATARLRPEWSFVLVGPVDPAVADRLDAVTGPANVVWLGERPSDAMPSYVQHFDVGAIWFVVDHLTRGVTPLKMFELLAAGTPCVSTPLPAALDEPAVVTAGDPEAMAAAIEQARATSVDDLRAAGEAADWTARLRPLVELLEAEGLTRAR